MRTRARAPARVKTHLRRLAGIDDVTAAIGSLAASTCERAVMSGMVFPGNPIKSAA
jgi:hypothetical protein